MMKPDSFSVKQNYICVHRQHLVICIHLSSLHPSDPVLAQVFSISSVKPGISLITAVSAAPQTAHVLISDEFCLNVADRLIPAVQGPAYIQNTHHFLNSGITLFTFNTKPGIRSNPILSDKVL